MKSIVTIVIIQILSQPYSIHSQCVSFRNTIYKTSGTNCGHRCTDRNVKNPTCNYELSAFGCFCKPGYFRDATWNCVPPQQCDAVVGQRSRDLAPTSFSSKQEAEDCPPNEVYSECGNYCTEKCRNTNDKYCPQNICDVGCFCIDGFFRGENGVCVPQAKCGIKLKERKSKDSKVCPYGEQYQKCAMRCQEACGLSRIKARIVCKGEKCEPGCFCIDTHSRNLNGECVPRKDCKKGGTCVRHEEFKLCGNSCTELCDPPEECPDKCKPGCYCRPGYLRNHKRKCVSDGTKIKTRLGRRLANRYEGVFTCQKSQAELDKPKMRTPGANACGKNEVDKKCSTRCGESCDTLGKDYVCPTKKTCINGCFCDKGFYRNSKNKCVSADKCKSKKGSKELDKKRKKLKKMCNKETEEFRECGNHCIELCGPPTVCPGECELGCFCKEGLLRNSDGFCVQEKSCPPLPKPPPPPQQIVKCGKGEKYADCKKDCIQNCAELKDKSVCPIRKKCLSGCLCMNKYYRDATGECVPEKQCSIKKPPPAPRSVKGANRKQDIPDCSKNEEYLSCGNYCIEMCKPPKKCAKKCQSGCFCKAKYFRNARGNCVRENKCEGKRIMHKIKLKIKDKCEKQNEAIKDCGYNCGQTCAEQAKHLVCPKRQACSAGCFCSPGTFRNRDGVCVPIKECKPRVGKYKPKTTTVKPKPPIPDCNEHEEYNECGDHCIELCQPPDSCETSCEPGCYCETGFYRPNPEGPCIPEENCPKEPESQKYKMKIKLKCEDNEIYSECGTRCGQMCVDLFKSIICPKKGLCVGGCFCKPGYYRNEKGKCVLESQCPDSRPKTDKPLNCDENEEFNKCGHRCQQSCETYLKKNECPKSKCGSGCFCKEGFYKDQYGNCIDPKDCTDPSLPSVKPESCGQNEKYIQCGNRCGQTCEELTQNRTCSEQRACVSGCFCDKGYRRNDNGLCAPEDDCYRIPKTRIKFEIKCEENEEYSKCEVRCGQACNDLGRKIDCPKSRQCASGCFCKNGFYRNEIGDCIPEAECPDVGPPDQIPKKLDCGPNEDYNECGTRCGQACDELGRRVACPKRRICISGCFCVEGHFRNYAGECVPMLECPDISPPKRPPPSCEANEEYNDCGKRCGQSCDDFKNNKQCPKKHVCVLGCFCDTEYKRDHNGDCVVEDTCPARDRDEVSPDSVKCGKNEEYNDCGTRCGQGCEDLIAGQTECSKRRQCVSGCFCVEGFYRNEIGECVPEKECPSEPADTQPKDCGENERYTDCGSQCGQSCEEADKAPQCPRKRMCIAGCFCKSGFFRDKYDNCVTRRQCAAKGKGEGKKKKKQMTTEAPEEEDQGAEDVADGGTDEPHSEEANDDTPDATEGTEGTAEEDSPEPTEEDKTTGRGQSKGESSEKPDSDEGPDEGKADKTEGSDQGKDDKMLKAEDTEGSGEGKADKTTEGSDEGKDDKMLQAEDTEGSEDASTSTREEGAENGSEENTTEESSTESSE